MEMASSSAKVVCLFLIMIMGVSVPCSAYDYIIKWETGFDPALSLSGVTLHPDDVLHFNYNPGSSVVYLVDQLGFTSCDVSRGKLLGDNGYTSFILPSTGVFYFISYFSECQEGMRLEAYVS